METPANGYAVSFGDNILNVDVKIGERTAEIAVDSLEGLGADKHRVRFRKAVGLAFRMEHFVDRCFTLLVPDLLEPAPEEKFVGVRHSTLRCGESIALTSA
jgi:hypothetical protein